MQKKYSLPDVDKELVLSCQNGNEESWDELTNRYLYRAKSLAIWVLPQYSHYFQQVDIEECMLITLMNAVFTFTPSKGKFYQFMLTVYRNEIIKMLKRNNTFSKYNFVSLDDLIPGSTESLTFEDVLSDEYEDPTAFCDEYIVSSQALYEFEKLDDLTKKIILLKIQDMSYKEIAEELHVSYKVVRSRFLKYKYMMTNKLKK